MSLDTFGLMEKDSFTLMAFLNWVFLLSITEVQNWKGYMRPPVSRLMLHVGKLRSIIKGFIS